jgi:hypothetical protein
MSLAETLALCTIAICGVIALAGLAGALAGAMMGYWSSLFLRGPQYQFPEWLSAPLILGWWPWPLFGAAVAGLIFLALLISRRT